VQVGRTYRDIRSTEMYAVVGLVVIAVYVSVLMIAMERTSFDVWGGVVLAPLLLVVTLPTLRRQALREGDASVFRFLLLALVVKLAGAFLRYYTSVFFYGGLRDANSYSKYGAGIAESFRHGDFTTGLKDLTGTNFVRFFTGLVYTVTGPSKLGGCVVFSWLGFCGLFFFYRAYTIVVPEGRRRSYAYLLFFLPSLIFWPSSIGKDAWMIFSMGLAAYGIAQLLIRWTIGSALLAAGGLWLASLVRLHVAAFMAIAFVAAVITRRSRSEHRELAPVFKGATVALVLLLAVALTLKTSGSLDVGVGGGLGAALTSVEDRTSKGGSDFSPTIADSPVRFPVAAITVLFRPFLFEAHNTQSRLAALESMALIALFLLRFRWMVAALRSWRRQPYVVFCLTYVILFIIGFSSFANFGLLARERVQLYPLLLVLLSIPPAVVERKGRAPSREAVPVSVP
jgi:hypothetical protein